MPTATALGHCTGCFCCCDQDNLPPTLTMTFSGGVGSCAYLNDPPYNTLTFTQEGGGGAVYSLGDMGLFCDVGLWKMTNCFNSCDCPGGVGTELIQDSCCPLHVYGEVLNRYVMCFCDVSGDSSVHVDIVGDCPSSSSSSSGMSSSSSSGTVCCETSEVPSSLTLTIPDGVNAGSYTIGNYYEDGNIREWYYLAPFEVYFILLDCFKTGEDTNTWRLTIVSGAYMQEDAISVVCDPFELTFPPMWGSSTDVVITA